MNEAAIHDGKPADATVVLCQTTVASQTCDSSDGWESISPLQPALLPELQELQPPGLEFQQGLLPEPEPELPPELLPEPEPELPPGPLPEPGPELLPGLLPAPEPELLPELLPEPEPELLPELLPEPGWFP